jgi:predicted nucleic acid-binding Zn ribbon protein
VSGDRSKRPTVVREVLQQYLRSAGLEERIEEASAVPEWAERVGPAIAGVTTPLRASGGTLVVAVRSSAWLMELRLMEAEILRQVNTGRKRGKFTRIRFLMAEG